MSRLMTWFTPQYEERKMPKETKVEAELEGKNPCKITLEPSHKATITCSCGREIEIDLLGREMVIRQK